jgi:hypothetical protein
MFARAADPGEHARFFAKPAHQIVVRGDLRFQQLDRDVGPPRSVARRPHLSHRADPELAHQLEPAEHHAELRARLPDWDVDLLQRGAYDGARADEAPHQLGRRWSRVGVRVARIADDRAYAVGQLAARVRREHLEQPSDRVNVGGCVSRPAIA